jgi:hypothetical protein
MAEYLPLRDPGMAITAQASAAITAGQLVEITGDNTVGPAGAASKKWRGVAAFDAADGDNVTVRSGGDHLLVASGAVAAGDEVAAAAAGKVATATSGQPIVGVAVVGAADGETATVAFVR